METHAHHLHHAPGKKFRHYLYEFLMLFVAVFCGFLAENYREQGVESHREKEYMKSMIEDLKRDTVDINRCIDFNTSSNQIADTLMNLLEKPSFTSSDILKMYLSYNSPCMGYGVKFSQRTLSQLKNSGMMRLIRNHDISDSLNQYDLNIAFSESIFKTVDEQTTLALNTACSIFDSRYTRTPARIEEIKTGKVIPVLLTTDKQALRQFANYAKVVQDVKDIHVRFLTYQKEAAVNLLKLIRNEYHID